MENAFRRYHLMGGELWAMKVVCRPSRRVFGKVFANLRPDRDGRFQYEFRVEQLVVLSFRRYLAEISSNNKLVIFFILLFGTYMQCVVRVSASKFQALIRSGAH